MATDGWGIDDGWLGTDGQWHTPSPDAIEAIGAAMGRTDQPSPPGRPVWIVRPGSVGALHSRCRLVLEDGNDLGAVDALTPDLPLGLHELAPLDGGPTTTLIVSPGRCHLPPGLRSWGMTVQVPSLRSRQGWGIGDLADVRALSTWLDGLGAGALALSPLHAPTPTPPIEASPYYPSSRRWRSPLLLRVDGVPGADDVPEVAQHAARARAASQDRFVDRDAVWHHQRSALELLWARRSDRTRADLETWRTARGAPLEAWARYCSIADRHGPRWTSWPRDLRRPDGPGVEAAARADPDGVAFHAWLQLLVERQLQDARVGGVRLIQDLAVGADPGGADSWVHQDLLALDVSIGAPPDDFAPEGQSWGLPPFVPWRLRDVGYRPLAELLRASLGQDGGLRIDHVMGLERLFWIPAGGAPADGAYVRHAPGELLEVVALESARARSVVIGEDLGTVEAGFRDRLRAMGVLSTVVAWFEDAPPETYPEQAVAMLSTHDLPTLAGVRTGADETELAALGRPTPEAARAELAGRLDALVGGLNGAPIGDLVDAAHGRLGRSPSMLALATAEDVCEVAERPNVPGTSTERPNWSQVLPRPVEDLVAEPSVSRHLLAIATGRAG